MAGDQTSRRVGLQDFNFPNQPSLLTSVQVPAGPHDQALVVVPDQVVTWALTETAREMLASAGGKSALGVHADESGRATRAPVIAEEQDPAVVGDQSDVRPAVSVEVTGDRAQRDLASQLRWDRGREVVVGVPPGLAVEPGQDANRSVGKHREQVICLAARESATDRGVTILPELVSGPPSRCGLAQRRGEMNIDPRSSPPAGMRSDRRGRRRRHRRPARGSAGEPNPRPRTGPGSERTIGLTPRLRRRAPDRISRLTGQCATAMIS